MHIYLFKNIKKLYLYDNIKNMKTYLIIFTVQFFVAEEQGL